MSAGGRAQIYRNCIFRRVKLYGDRHDQVYEPEGDRSREMDAEQEFSDRAVVNLRWRNVVPGERINGEQIDLVFAGPERVGIEVKADLRPAFEIDDVAPFEPARLVEHIRSIRADDVDIDADTRSRLVMDQRRSDHESLKLAHREGRFAIHLKRDAFNRHRRSQQPGRFGDRTIDGLRSGGPSGIGGFGTMLSGCRRRFRDTVSRCPADSGGEDGRRFNFRTCRITDDALDDTPRMNARPSIAQVFGPDRLEPLPVDRSDIEIVHRKGFASALGPDLETRFNRRARVAALRRPFGKNMAALAHTRSRQEGAADRALTVKNAAPFARIYI